MGRACLPRGGVIAAAREIGVTLDARQLETLEAFVALVERWNAKFNLLSRRDIDRIWTRHVLDSLSLLPLLPAGRVLDLGSGGGFPGMPLAIADPDHEYVLVDRRERRIRFLELAVHVLGIANVTCIRADAARLSIPPVEVVVARAVSSLVEVWALASRVLAPGGRLVAMTTTRDAEDAAPGTGTPVAARIERVVEIRIPGLDRAHRVTIVRRSVDEG